MKVVQELKRRNVFRVVIAADSFEAPAWVMNINKKSLI
jgi:hypothetical protein